MRDVVIRRKRCNAAAHIVGKEQNHHSKKIPKNQGQTIGIVVELAKALWSGHLKLGEVILHGIGHVATTHG